MKRLLEDVEEDNGWSRRSALCRGAGAMYDADAAALRAADRCGAVLPLDPDRVAGLLDLIRPDVVLVDGVLEALCRVCDLVVAGGSAAQHAVGGQAILLSRLPLLLPCAGLTAVCSRVVWVLTLDNGAMAYRVFREAPGIMEGLRAVVTAVEDPQAVSAAMLALMAVLDPLSYAVRRVVFTVYADVMAALLKHMASPVPQVMVAAVRLLATVAADLGDAAPGLFALERGVFPARVVRALEAAPLDAKLHACRLMYSAAARPMTPRHCELLVAAGAGPCVAGVLRAATTSGVPALEVAALDVITALSVGCLDMREDARLHDGGALLALVMKLVQQGSDGAVAAMTALCGVNLDNSRAFVDLGACDHVAAFMVANQHGPHAVHLALLALVELVRNAPSHQAALCNVDGLVPFVVGLLGRADWPDVRRTAACLVWKTTTKRADAQMAWFSHGAPAALLSLAGDATDAILQQAAAAALANIVFERPSTWEAVAALGACARMTDVLTDLTRPTLLAYESALVVLSQLAQVDDVRRQLADAEPLLDALFVLGHPCMLRTAGRLGHRVVAQALPLMRLLLSGTNTEAERKRRATLTALDGALSLPRAVTDVEVASEEGPACCCMCKKADGRAVVLSTCEGPNIHPFHVECVKALVEVSDPRCPSCSGSFVAPFFEAICCR